MYCASDWQHSIALPTPSYPTRSKAKCRIARSLAEPSIRGIIARSATEPHEGFCHNLWNAIKAER